MEVGFGLPYKLYQKLLCLLLVCTSPTLSGISTISQQVVSTLFGCQLRLTVILKFGIPYILYQKSLCLFLVFTSPTLSGISTVMAGGGLNSLESQLIPKNGIKICHSLYALPEDNVLTCGVHFSNTLRYFYS